MCTRKNILNEKARTKTERFYLKKCEHIHLNFKKYDHALHASPWKIEQFCDHILAYN